MNKKNIKTTLILTILGLLATTNILFFYYGNNTTIKSVNSTLDLKSSGIVNNTIFMDDFESGLSKWASITGLWDITNSSSSYSDPYHSYESSMWFGQESTGDYATGSQEEGNLTSTTFDLTSYYQASLEFYHWRASEAARDFSYVYISTDGNNWDELYNSDLPISPWQQKIIDISSYCGNASVTLRFYFETSDEVANNYRGWLVDDVKVTALQDDTTSPVVTVNPSDFAIEFGYTGQSLSWTATDTNPFNYTISLQGTGLIAGPTAWTSGNGVTYNIPDGFAVGDYVYTINFTDRGGNFATDPVTFSVEDTINPSITVSPSDFSVELGYSGQSLSWTATDPHPDMYTISLEGTGVIAGPTAWTSGNEITYNIPNGFSVGDYMYTVNFTDDYDNFATDTVTFAVEDTTSPSITVAPSDFSVELGYTGQSVSWTATDPNPFNYTITLEGTGIIAGPTAWTSGNGITYYIPDGFGLGDFVYTVNFTDDELNFATDSVTFTVGDTTSPSITVAPSDFAVELGYTSESLSWNATDPNPFNYTITLEGTGIVAGPTAWTSGNGITYNIPDGFSLGDYVYTVNFTDDNLNFVTDSVTFTVGDTISPSITVAPSDFAVELGYTSESLSWNATDPNPFNYTITLEGTGIVAGPTAWTSGNGVLYDIPDGFAIGAYVYTINFTDDFYNFATDSVTFSVEDITSPAITINPSDFSQDLGYTGQSISWTATDPNPFNYTITLQGTGIVAGPTAWTSGNPIVYNIPDGFGYGSYTYTVNFTDDYNNFVTDSVIFTVGDSIDPVIVSNPSDSTVEFGYTGQTLTWNVTDANPLLYTITLQGTGIVTGPTAWTSGTLVTYNIPDGFNVGSYVYIINFTDSVLNFASDTVTFTVEDTTDPIITVAPIDLVLNSGYTGETLSWTATDGNPGTYTIVLQGTGAIAGPTAWTSGNSVIYNVPDGLTTGDHIYNITFTDSSGNSVSDLVTVTVLAATTPAPGIPFGNFYLLFIVGGIVVSVILKKRKKNPNL